MLIFRDLTMRRRRNQHQQPEDDVSPLRESVETIPAESAEKEPKVVQSSAAKLTQPWWFDHAETCQPLTAAALRRALSLQADPRVRESCGDAMAPAASLALTA
jgi:hypothetical protein